MGGISFPLEKPTSKPACTRPEKTNTQSELRVRKASQGTPLCLITEIGWTSLAGTTNENLPPVIALRKNGFEVRKPPLATKKWEY